jgi:hypothetical protein
MMPPGDASIVLASVVAIHTTVVVPAAAVVCGCDGGWR